jgi:hypothetical protein
MPVLARRRDEIREPVEKLKRRQFDRAVGSRSRRRTNRRCTLLTGGEHGREAGNPQMLRSRSEGAS